MWCSCEKIAIYPSEDVIGSTLPSKYRSTAIPSKMRYSHRYLAEVEVPLMPSGPSFRGALTQSVRLPPPPTTSMKSLSIELQLLVIAHLPPRDIVHLQQVSYPLHALLGQQ